MFDGGNYPASVTAIDDATLLFVSKQDFQSLCITHPQVSLKVLRVVGARLRRLVGIIEELSFTTVRHRLAAFLVRLAKASGKRTEKGLRSLCQQTTRNWRRKSALFGNWFRGICLAFKRKGCSRSKAAASSSLISKPWKQNYGLPTDFRSASHYSSCSVT